MNDINQEDKIKEKLSLYLGSNTDTWPKAVRRLVCDEASKDHMGMTALAMAITYLEQLLQAEVTVPVAEFYTQDEHS